MQIDTRIQINDGVETVSDLVWSAERRFDDGAALLGEGRFDGGLYLAGLSAEMLLKVACFRFRGNGPERSVKAQLYPARDWMKARAPGLDFEQFHSLRWWSTYLRLLREDASDRMSAELESDLIERIETRLHANWCVSMRYRRLVIDKEVAWESLVAVSWLRQQSEMLGSRNASA